jgi:hypothetical protein
MGAVFALASQAGDLATAAPESVATGMRITFAAGAALIVVALGFAVAGRALARPVRTAVAPACKCQDPIAR